MVRGELIGASSRNFELIYKKCNEIFNTYLNNLKALNHIGDETIFNAALQLLDLKTLDLGNLNIIERKWSSICLFDQLPIKTIHKISLVRLPSSKNFILNLPILNFKILKFIIKLFLIYSLYLNFLKNL